MRELIKKMKEIDNKFSGKIECISIPSNTLTSIYRLEGTVGQ